MATAKKEPEVQPEDVVDPDEAARAESEAEAAAKSPSARKKEAEDNLADSVDAAGGADVVALVAALPPDELVRLKTALGIRDDSTPAPTPAPPVPLHVDASRHPIWVDATKDMSGSSAAKLLECDVDDLLGYSVRAPLNIDGNPIGDKAVLTGSFSDGSKRAVEYAVTK